MDELRYQKEKLRKNLELLQSRQRENGLLESVIQDYSNYYKHMKDQDEAHAKKLEFITKYIEDVMETNQLTESGLNQLEYEHGRILSKMDKVKNKINQLVLKPINP